MTPAAAGHRERNEQREQQIAYPLDAQGPGGKVPGQPMARKHLQQQEGTGECFGGREGRTEGRHSLPLPHPEQGAGIEAYLMLRLVKLPSHQQQQGYEIERVDAGQPQPEETAIADGATRATTGLPIDVGQHQAAQDAEEIDPEIAVLDELSRFGDGLLPLGKEQQSGVEQHHHQGSDAPQRRQQRQ